MEMMNRFDKKVHEIVSKPNATVKIVP